ncbi:hypothetical protein LI328DRAFT_125236 [Trichoderma asperelloides]|nr:hypothetical protein LI328DRAFT_125236 [Trichoderma asperelloides]
MAGFITKPAASKHNPGLNKNPNRCGGETIERVTFLYHRDVSSCSISLSERLFCILFFFL